MGNSDIVFVFCGHKNSEKAASECDRELLQGKSLSRSGAFTDFESSCYTLNIKFNQNKFMIASHDCLYVSPEDYLAGERVSPIKHEYRDGEIYAMVGAKNPHVLITLNLVTLLRTHLRGTGCLPFAMDTKVRIETTNSYYYPDFSVSCDRRDTHSLEDFIHFPVLIIEVLSPSTEAFDRGEKFADYRTLDSLQEYVLIRQNRISVECYRRNSQGRWELYSYTEGQEIELASVNFSCAIAQLYEDVPRTL